MPPLVRRCCVGDRLAAYAAFGIIALANTILPFIVFSSNYLIIPYPRAVVILIETIPALVVKLLLPHVLHRVPYWIRPLAVASCWIVLAIVAKVTPPNVPPPVRISASMLASATAAATDVSMLGMMRYYGRTGLAGWAAGTGAGALASAVLPYAVTVWMYSFLREAIDCVYCLTGVILFACFVILPRAPMNHPERHQGRGKDLESDRDASESLPVDDSKHVSSRNLSRGQRINLLSDLIQPFILPLAVAAGSQAIAFPGVSRALPKSSEFQTFFLFSTSYGALLQLGNFVSRTSAVAFRFRNMNTVFLILGAAVSVLLLNAMFACFSSQLLIGAVVFCIGLAGGAIYAMTLMRLIGEKASEHGLKQEACLQTVGLGETAGLVIGGLASTAIETVVCTIGVGSLGRWCDGPY